MDFPSDLANEGRSEVLGLSPDGFRKFLTSEGHASELELAANPTMILDLMESPLWSDYQETAERAWLERTPIS